MNTDSGYKNVKHMDTGMCFVNKLISNSLH